jgi:RNA polymerase sigma factor (sigma-70 family)
MRELVARCRTGDREAFGALVERTRAWALRYARSMLNGDLRAEDAVQEAYLVAWTRIDSLRNDEAFIAWLRCLIRTQVNRIARRRADLELDGGEAAGPTSRRRCAV